MGRRSFRMKKNKYSLKLGMCLAIFAVLCLSVGMFLNTYKVNKKAEACSKQIEILNEKIAAEEDRTKEIAEYGKYTKTKKFAEEEAKEKLGLVNENEIIFKTEN